MKNIIDKIKKYDLDVILIAIIIVIGLSFVAKVTAEDELWNFANCYKMHIGYEIYNEINVIITPLFFYIAQLFFKIFGATIFSFRIYNIAISFALLMLIYKIFKALKITRRRTIIYFIIITYSLMSLITARSKL